MSTESQAYPPAVRHQNAIDSLHRDVSMHELAYLLLLACEEVVSEGKDPMQDPAVILLSGRIGFASPASTMSSKTWYALLDVCKAGKDIQLTLKTAKLQ